MFVSVELKALSGARRGGGEGTGGTEKKIRGTSIASRIVGLRLEMANNEGVHRPRRRPSRKIQCWKEGQQSHVRTHYIKVHTDSMISTPASLSSIQIMPYIKSPLQLYSSSTCTPHLSAALLRILIFFPAGHVRPRPQKFLFPSTLHLHGPPPSQKTKVENVAKAHVTDPC